jgi:hypothetical protein
MRHWVALLAVLLCAGCGSSGGGGDGPRFSIEGLALSPEGALVAVQFTDHELKTTGFGLYDWRRAEFTPLAPPPGGRAYIDPSFSADGKSLVAVSDNQLYLIDLASKKADRLTEGGIGFKEHPVFAPDGSGILYVGSSPARLEFIKLPERTEVEVIDPQDGFGTLSAPAFGGNDRVIFLATDPRNPTLYEQVMAFPDARAAIDRHAYGLKFGAKPEMILKNLWSEAKAKSAWYSGPQDLRASKDALKILYIDSVDKAPELFLIENNAIRQLTHLQGVMRLPAISYDGSIAAFVGDSSRNSLAYNLHILDLATGKESSTGLLNRLKLPEQD